MELFEQVPCGLCGAHEFKVLIPKPQTDMSKENLLKVYKSSSDEKLLDQLVECKECRLVFLNPRVKSDIILQSYSDAVDPKFVAQNPMRIATFKKELSRLMGKLGITASKDKRVLDIGSAGGAFLKAANDLGFSTVGVEPSRWLCEYGHKEYGLDLRPGILEDYTNTGSGVSAHMQLAPKSFDIITLWDVIEHLTDPEKTMGQVRNLLKDDGYLVVNYPDYDSWVAKLMGRHWPFLLSVHLIYFTPETIKKFLGKCGFEVVETGPHWQTLELGYVLERAEKYIAPIKMLRVLTFKLGLAKLPLAYYLGQTRVVVKKKNF